jgi:phosphohistidine phosphatase
LTLFLLSENISFLKKIPMKSPAESVRKGKHLLLLVRHGRAAPKNAGLTDFERTLTPQGREESESVAAATRDRLHSIDLLISSPADRALETAHAFAPFLNYPARKIRIVEMIYFADSIQPLVGYVQHLGNVGRTVALFGHNPLFEELAAYWLPGFSKNLPKSSSLGIEFEIDSWADASRGKGNLLFFLVPSKRGGKAARRTRPPGAPRRSGLP